MDVPKRNTPSAGPSARVWAWGLVALVVGVFGATLNDRITLDGRYFLLEDPRVQQQDWAAALTTDWWDEASRDGEQRGPGGLYRPLSLLWLMALGGMTDADSRASGQAPWVQLGNLLLHVAVSLARFYFLMRLFRFLPNGRWWAGVSAVLLAIHPVATEAVCTQVGCAEGLATLCATLALGALLRLADGDGGRGLLVFHVLAFLLSLLAKESAVALPGVVVLILVWGRGWTWRRALLWTVPSVLVFGAWLLLRLAILGSVAAAGDPVYALFSTPARWASAFSVVARYGLPAILWPFRLHPNPSFMELPPPSEFSSVSVLVGLVASVSIAVAVFWNRRRRPLVALGLATFGGLFLPVSNVVISIGAVTATRFFYLPLLGLAVAAGALAAQSRLARISLTVWILVSLAATIRELPRWQDQQVLFDTACERYPDAIQGWYQAGAIRIEGGKQGSEFLAARECFDRAAACPVPTIPGHPDLFHEDALELAFQASFNAGVSRMSQLPGTAGAPDLVEADAAFLRAEQRAQDGQRIRSAGFHPKTRWSELEARALLARADLRFLRMSEQSADGRAGTAGKIRQLLEQARRAVPGHLAADLAEIRLEPETAGTALPALFERALAEGGPGSVQVIQTWIDTLRRSGRKEQAASAYLRAHLARRSAGTVTELVEAVVLARRGTGETRLIAEDVATELLQRTDLSQELRSRVQAGRR